MIGIAMQTLDAVPGQLPLCWVMGQRYVRALTAVGAVPWLIPLLPGDETTLRTIFSQLDGVFLTGGVDVDPTSYHESRQPFCGTTDPARDWTEIHLVRWSIAEHKPLLGVCRGIQAINVAAGGTLYQDVQTQLPHAIKHDYFPGTHNSYLRDTLMHPVRIVPETRLGRILQTRETLVNSMHHQGLKQLAPGLMASAFAPDGLIEGVEGTNGQFLIGVQWHPEELVDQPGPMRALFHEFVHAAQLFRQELG